jgi:hypothetical protein
MAANKKKKEVKVRDLKPSKDAKGGGGRVLAGRTFEGRTLNAGKTLQGGTGKVN